MKSIIKISIVISMALASSYSVCDLGSQFKAAFGLAKQSIKTDLEKLQDQKAAIEKQKKEIEDKINSFSTVQIPGKDAIVATIKATLAGIDAKIADIEGSIKIEQWIASKATNKEGLQKLHDLLVVHQAEVEMQRINYRAENPKENPEIAKILEILDRDWNHSEKSIKIIEEKLKKLK